MIKADQIGAKDDVFCPQWCSAELCLFWGIIILEGGRRDILTGYFSLRLDELYEVGLDEGEPLLDAAFDVPASIAHIADH